MQTDWMKRAIVVHRQIEQCDKKIHFRTKGQALIFADRKQGDAKRAYRCPICGEWHLSSH